VRRPHELTLLRYARPYRAPIGLLIATMAINLALTLAEPWPLKLVFDDVLSRHRAPGLVTSLLPGAAHPTTLALYAAVMTVLVFGLQAASSAGYTYASLRLGQRLVLALAGDVFAHLQRLSLRQHASRELGDTIARVTGDTYCVSTLVTDAAVPAAQAVLTLLAVLVVLWLLQPWLSLLAIAVLPALFLIVRRFGGEMQTRARAQRDAESEMYSTVEQTFSALPLVQSYAQEPREERRFRAAVADLTSATLRSTIAGLRFEIAAGVVTAVGTAAVIYVGARLALAHQLTPGSIIVFLSYLRTLYDPVDQIAQTGSTIQSARAEAERVLELLETEPEVRQRPDARHLRLAGSVQLVGVSFGYTPDRTVLEGIDLRIEPGETLAIVGPSGAGKSTLVRLLSRLHDPWTGTITIGLHDIRDLTLASLRSQVALVTQDPLLMPVTIAENIAYGRPDAKVEEIVDAARRARAHDFITRLPNGYATRLAERGSDLSGGERQRLAIARGLLSAAPVLVLDEPTAALDPETEVGLLSACADATDGRATIVIAHRLSTIRHADAIAVLDCGRIVQYGTHDELLNQDGRYADMVAAAEGDPTEA
jgi:ATP-binding cassette subfamily B protein/subfamily B ATP-binding cassette protein MsbA